MAKKNDEHEDHIPAAAAPAHADPQPAIEQPPCEPATEQGRTVALLEKIRATINEVLASMTAPPEVISRLNQIIRDAAAGVPPDEHREAATAAKPKA
jgi:ribonuclease D